MNKKALIAMSGGVDSSVAAYLVKQQGYDCQGAIMRLHDTFLDQCNADPADVADARSICQKLDIPFHVFDFRHQFNQNVIDRFINSYESGNTPNPCVDCNKNLKFGKFLTQALSMDMDCIVTGHYAVIERCGDTFYLKKGSDAAKDQTYFLYHLTQHQLSHIIFPLGTMTKTQIREIAETDGFINARKKDSQDICFVPNGDYSSVIRSHTGKTYPHGDFVNLQGDVVGRHSGIINYTVGQRKGLGCAFGEKLYVYGKDIDANRVILARNEELFSSSLDAVDFSWISGSCPASVFKAYAKIRSSAKETPVTVCVTGDCEVHLDFDTPQRAIAKGQAVVLYDGDYVLGGGTIV